MERFFEDYAVGQRFEAGTIVASETAIVEFARAYDPQVFHVDPDAAQATVFGRLVASGWQTASWTMRLLVDGGILGSNGAIGMGTDELRWLAPVYAGDALTVVAEVTQARPSASRPGGTIRMHITTRNQHGTGVMSQLALVMVPGRSTPRDA